MTASDWLDLVHHYITERTDPDKLDNLNRILTGDLDTFMPAPVVQERPALPPPPPWLRIRPADLARMARARQEAAQAP